jgi:hypothetical protein
MVDMPKTKPTKKPAPSLERDIAALLHATAHANQDMLAVSSLFSNLSGLLDASRKSADHGLLSKSIAALASDPVLKPIVERWLELEHLNVCACCRSSSKAVAS